MRKILISAILCATAVSCSLDPLPPSSQYVEDSFWQTYEQIDAGLTACYNALYNQYSIGGNSLIFSETGTPNAFNYANAGGWRVIGNGTVNTVNSGVVNSKWGACYSGIGRCNTFIVNSPDFDPNEVSSSERDDMVGEAKFLRALYYFDLTTNYGDAPLILDKPDVASQSYLPRDPAEKIVVQVITDLNDAFNALPDTPSQTGRPSKWAAKALLARVYLYNEMWQEAENAAKEVIDSKKYSLYPNYRNLFMPDHENNSEIIFSVQYSYPTYSHQGDGLDVLMRQYNTIAPTLDLVKAYDMADGTPYTDDKDLYTGRDPRFAATIVYPGAIFMGNEITEATYPNTGYTFKKYCRYDTAAAVQDDRNEIDIILMRYADVLLMYAEARNERLGTPDEEVYNAINEVRQRPTVTMPRFDISTDSFSKEEMREKIRHERRIEFAGEGWYYNDIRRWRIAEELMNGTQPLKYDGTAAESVRIFTERNYLFPIPQQETDDNPNLLPNNPGWN